MNTIATWAWTTAVGVMGAIATQHFLFGGIDGESMRVIAVMVFSYSIGFFAASIAND